MTKRKLFCVADPQHFLLFYIQGSELYWKIYIPQKAKERQNSEFRIKIKINLGHFKVLLHDQRKIPKIAALDECYKFSTCDVVHEL